MEGESKQEGGSERKGKKRRGGSRCFINKAGEKSQVLYSQRRDGETEGNRTVFQR